MKQESEKCYYTSVRKDNAPENIAMIRLQLNLLKQSQRKRNFFPQPSIRPRFLIIFFLQAKMTYSNNFRRKVLTIKGKEDLSFAETSHHFGIGINSVVLWSRP